jgi:predicted ATPase
MIEVQIPLFLRSVTIKNYRSLEDVRLEGLARFNVLIGRNNSGKSSVFGALQVLYGSLTGNGSDWERVLTDLEPNRSLEIVLTFESRKQDREEFIDLVSTTEEQKRRRADMVNSPLMCQMEFSFSPPVGQPQLLHLRSTRVLTENNMWALVQEMVGPEQTSNPSSRVIDLDSYGGRHGARGLVLDDTLMDMDTLTQGGLAELTGETTVSELARQAIPDAHGLPVSANVWPQMRLLRYLREAFFFDLFRHSVESAEVQQTDQLGQDGSNFAQVLHTINSNDRSKFQEIEHFVQAALPDIGELQTPLDNTMTRISFRRPPGGYPVRLHDMGAGSNSS